VVAELQLTFPQNDIPAEEWNTALELWAREYLKGEGE
jgi:hypothetical protein